MIIPMLNSQPHQTTLLLRMLVSACHMECLSSGQGNYLRHRLPSSGRDGGLVDVGQSRAASIRGNRRFSRHPRYDNWILASLGNRTEREVPIELGRKSFRRSRLDRLEQMVDPKYQSLPEVEVAEADSTSLLVHMGLLEHHIDRKPRALRSLEYRT